MFPGENVSGSLEDYKANEIQLHRELMNSCRKYINRLGIVSIVGILDVVKQEVIELERATRNSYQNEENKQNEQ